MKKKTTLYRYFDENGKLLYVGITGDNTKRQSQHRRSSFWFGQIASATFEHYETREEALDAESIAIEKEKPAHNQHHGSVLKHSDWTHMVYLAGKPDGGHDETHSFFARVFSIHFEYQNKRLNSSNQVLAKAMNWSKEGNESVKKNLRDCELCQEAYQSAWYLTACKELGLKP